MGIIPAPIVRGISTDTNPWVTGPTATASPDLPELPHNVLAHIFLMAMMQDNEWWQFHHCYVHFGIPPCEWWDVRDVVAARLCSREFKNAVSEAWSTLKEQHAEEHASLWGSLGGKPADGKLVAPKELLGDM
jgi:hypothetical protein